MDVFDGLADPVRRDLLRRLTSGPRRAGDLVAGHGISRPAVSRHLRVLAQAGLVEASSVGRERWFRLREEGVEPVHRFLTELRAAGPRRAAPVTEEQLLALDTEVRRTVRERAGSSQATGHPDRTDTSDHPERTRPAEHQESA
ncbi:ArsR/SmtB family transcription factor [Jannaschia sp. R86511]|uniref:ArsR/SmtB family transcription factor n=1 Tax=Jannaschia sp. R86511 TaxID=3093853 RepID=UPI0036D2DC76